MRSERHSIIWQMLLPIPIVSGLALVTAAILLPPVVSENAVESAVESARQLVDGFRTARTYYSKVVVAKVTSTGAFKATNEYRDKPDAIPLPATMIHDLSDAFKSAGASFKLYSPYPFPNRAGRKLDASAPNHGANLQPNPSACYRAGRPSTARKSCASASPTSSPTSPASPGLIPFRARPRPIGSWATYAAS